MSSTSAQQAAKTARKRSNLAFALVSLAAERREAMCIFYDFCRCVDDIADEPIRTIPQKYGELKGWQEAILSWENSWANSTGAPSPVVFPEGTVSISPDGSLERELGAIVLRYRVNPQHLLDIIGGVIQDVEPKLFADFPSLKRYCYGVASAVGMASIKIFGCTDPLSEPFAESLGYALQFTNILRDIREDFEEKGRVYLPQDELAFFGVTPEILIRDKTHAGRHAFLQLQYYRAKHFFNRARRFLTEKDRKPLKAALIMSAIYEAILETIRANEFSIEQRVSLSKVRKIAILAQTLRQLKRPLKPLRRPGKAAVFGAGIAGIGTAVLLGLEGFDVELFEARKFAGGRACSMRDSQTGITLDNGQHIAMGCYRSFLNLAALLGVEKKLRKSSTLDITYIDKGGKRFGMKSPRLPLGAGMAIALCRFKKLSFKDKFAVVRFAMGLRCGLRPQKKETASQWLARCGQTEQSRYALWRPFCVAALNQPLETADAGLFHETLVRSLFAGSEAAAIFLSKVPLGELFYPEAARFLQSIGSQAHLGAQVSSLRFENGNLAGFTIADDPTVRQADLYASALNWQALKKLLPSGDATGNALEQIPAAGILNIHLISDKKLFDEPFVGFLDSPVHWVFDRSDLLNEAERGKKHLYALTLSCPGEWENEASQNIRSMVERELSEHFPECAPINFSRGIVVKTKDATFAARPEVEPLRPDAQNIPGLLLAGDYTNTGLPATMESAAQSAYRLVQCLDKSESFL